MRTSYNEYMVRIWVKIMQGEKIVRQYVYEKEELLVWSHFFVYVSELCAELDIPTPVVVKTHIFNFAKFRNVRFLPRDFVEEVDFDKLVLENLSV